MKKLLFFFLGGILPLALQAQEIVQLHKNWEFRQEGKQNWNAASVPGVVHLDLLNSGQIEEPYKGNNELEQQWIEGENWEYMTLFEVDADYLEHTHINLVFEGLDTYSTVMLNGVKVFDTDNMFRTWKKDVRPYLKPGINELRVTFTSPLKKHAETITNRPYELPAANETVEAKVSPYTRKAAYQFGWDWGPRFVTCGIWRPVYLEAWDEVNVENVGYQIESIQSAKAQVVFSFDLEVENAGTYLINLNGNLRRFQLTQGKHTLYQSLEMNNFKKWYPLGKGEQDFNSVLYTIQYQSKEERARENARTILEDTIEVAIREIELINEPDDIGTSFYFKVNGEPMFMKGANYIPQDLFLPRVDSSRYETLIQQVVDANMNMLRVWGGGIYENDYFYELCDRNGILVWQDFMFANSMYPNDEAFKLNVRLEIEDNVKRLRNHPCIAIWCGNNEIEVAWGNWGWQKQYGYSKADSAEIWNNHLSIFHDLIPNVLQELDRTRPYTKTSPLSNWGTAENFNHSSMHYWGVWHGKDDLEDYANNVGRFMTEWGYQSFPSYQTLVKVMDKSELTLSSPTMKNRQKSYIGNGILMENVKKYHGKKSTPEKIGFEKWIDLTQEVQAYAYKLAIDAHRSKSPHCMGTLFWQLNDCWPGPSWSVIDYYGNEKKAYEAVKAAFSE